MEQTFELLEGLRNKVDLLRRNRKIIQQENRKIKQEVDELKEKIRHLEAEKKSLREELRLLRLSEGIKGGADTSEVKKKIKAMVRDIDKCVSILSS